MQFKLPDIGEGIAEAEIVKWLVAEGESIEQDQPLLEVQTDKAVVELPAPMAGEILEQKWAVGDLVQVGEVLVIIKPIQMPFTEDALHTSTDSEYLSELAAPTSSSDQRQSLKATEKSCAKVRVLAAPSTRRIARELNVDIFKVQGTGPKGRVMEQDVRDYILPYSNQELSQSNMPNSLHSSPDIQEFPLSATRKLIGSRLQHSLSHKPHATHFAEINVEGLVRWKQERQNISYFPALLKIIALTLQKHSLFNAHYIELEEKIVQFSSVSFGIAVDTTRGLLVPVIKQLELKNIKMIAQELKHLTASAREGKIQPAQMKGSTFTVSNAGPLGGNWATPIINEPEVAIIALHPIIQKPVIVNGKLSVGWRMNISLSFDHRVLDGAEAIRFTNTIGYYTEDLTRIIEDTI